MPKFQYVGRSREGEEKKGVIDAPNLAEAEVRVKALGVNPDKVGRAWGQIEIKLPRMGGVKLKTMVVFSRQLATMIDAGLPLVQCLDILGSQEPDPEFKRIVFGIKAQVESGATLADSLKRFPKVFDTLFVSLVAAGEVGGILDTILNRLAQYQEKSMKTRQKVAGAMKYPTFVFTAAVGILVLFMWKIIPSFAQMFSSIGKRGLPAMTQMTVNMSNWFIGHMAMIVVITIGIVVSYQIFKRRPAGRKILDTLLLKTPVIGDLMRKSAIARFTRTLGTLVSSGVPILDGLDVVARSAGNVVIENAVLYVKARVAEGKNIATPLAETKIFPAMVVQMISVGESTGAMDVMLTKIADFYDDEVDTAVDGMTSLIEPLIMVVIGGMVGFLMISMYLPIFSMADNLSGQQ